MSKAKKVVFAILLLCACISFFASCGMGSEKQSYEIEADEDLKSYSYVKDYGDISEEEVISSDISSAENSAPLEGRKIIRTVSITAETKEYDAALRALESSVSALGGYVQSSDTTGVSLYSGRIYSRSASYTIRIPAEKLDEFLSDVGELLNISSSNSNIDDITETYVDIEARLKTLRTEEARLLELLEEAKGLSDIITLESRLSEVTYQIESYTARLRSYDTLVAYSTVNIDISEVVDYSSPAVQNPTFGERISEASKESWAAFAEGWRDFAVGFVYALPSILLVAVAAAVIAIIIVSIRRRAKKRRMTKKDENNLPPTPPESPSI